MKRQLVRLASLVLSTYSLILILVGCSPDKSGIVGEYVARRQDGSDTLVLQRDGLYLQTAVIRGRRAVRQGRWWINRGDLILNSPLYVDSGAFADSLILRPIDGVQGISLDWFWLNRSLNPGEGAPSYRRIQSSR